MTETKITLPEKCSGCENDYQTCQLLDWCDVEFDNLSHIEQEEEDDDGEELI